ncbi:hypothetical protein ECG_02739 [Echinococcus granulosus]|uniref:Amiloride-sensitive sodium channel-related protein n=2 Tax=Echinococcus granulosus TaxID=6210 RepID=W6UBJ6_ECHGR|nr:amiloride-sensitive sodium channel-related protein [Echinococcus granulosus]EUB58460.1 amiloride-sensitive sodium channel-related protein [Echinococcus granulosus]KAH9284101.1 hypothetical protein ECG_02739 [Echinococcus granulosus]
MSQEPNTEAATEARRSKQSRWDHGDEFSRNGRSKSKFSQIYELFIHFCENTSLRGVPQIVRSSDRRNRLLWLNFISIFFIACIACLIITTNQYLQYNVIHQPKRIFDAPRAFLSLTICNLRPFKSSGVDRLIRQGAVPVQAYFDVIMKVASTLDKRYASQFTTLFSLESYLLNLPEGMDPSNLGHRLEQLVQTCVVLYQNGTLIRGTDCGKAGYWVKTLNQIYHNCYTYELDPQIRDKT